MLQTQLQEAQQALGARSPAAQRQPGDPPGEEGRVLLQDKTELQKQVPAPLSQRATLPQHSQASHSPWQDGETASA